MVLNLLDTLQRKLVRMKGCMLYIQLLHYFGIETLIPKDNNQQKEVQIFFFAKWFCFKRVNLSLDERIKVKNEVILFLQEVLFIS